MSELTKLPGFDGWINTSLITDIQAVGGESSPVGFVELHFGSEYCLESQFSSVEEATGAAKVIVGIINE